MSLIASATANYASATSKEDGAVLSQNFDQFLVLLTTQMKYQDPLNPMDSSEFTNQLVQYSQVEQQIKTNNYLDQVAAYTASNETITALGLIGLQIKHEGSSFKFAGGENGSIAMSYSLPTDAQITTINIKDSEGNTVATASGEIAEGDYIFAWDGKDLDGNPVDAGIYKFEVFAVSSTGANITTVKTVPGYVEGVQTADDGTMELIVNGTTIPLSKVSSARL